MVSPSAFHQPGAIAHGPIQGDQRPAAHGHGVLFTDDAAVEPIAAGAREPNGGQGAVTGVTAASATVAGTVAQGIYGSDQATLWVFCGSQDGGTVRANWQQSVRVGVT